MPETSPHTAEQTANLVGRFFAIAETVGDKPLFFRKIDGNWQGLSWAEANRNVRKLASVLVAAGVNPGDRGIISAENRPEWAI